MKLGTYTLHKINHIIQGNKYNPNNPPKALEIIKAMLTFAGFGYEFDAAAEQSLYKVASEKIVIESDTVYDVVKKILADCKCRLYLNNNIVVVKGI